MVGRSSRPRTYIALLRSHIFLAGIEFYLLNSWVGMVTSFRIINYTVVTQAAQ